jgi:Mpv17 / PMP22 family
MEQPNKKTDNECPTVCLSSLPSPSTISTLFSSTTTLLNEFYLSFPYLSAFVTCSCKAGVADFIVQQHHRHHSTTTTTSSSSMVSSISTTKFKQTEIGKQDISPLPSSPHTFQVGRNIGFILYGGFYQGLFQQYMYGTVFPQYFEDVTTTTTTTAMILQQLLMDMLILGPLLCLPISYIVQSICAPSSAKYSTISTVPTTTTSSSSSSFTGGLSTPWMKRHSMTTIGYGWDHNIGTASNNRFPQYLNQFPLSMLVAPWTDHHQTPSPLVPMTARTSSSSAVLWSDFNDRRNSLEYLQDKYDSMFWLDHFPVVAAFYDTLLHVPIMMKIRDGIEQYMADIHNQNILMKYWLLWIPIKCITFTIIPNHLRIVFIATISFFWMMILSSSSSAPSTSIPTKTVSSSNKNNNKVDT